MEASTAASSSSSAVAFYKLFGHADILDVAAMTAGGLSSLAHGASVPMFLLVLGKLINSLGNLSVDTHAMSKQVSTYALYFVYLSLARLVTGYFEVSLWMYTGERQAARLRTEFLKALLSQDVGFFDTNMSSGDVVASISHDLILIQDAIGTKTGNVIHYIGQFVTGMVIAFVCLWQVSLLTLAVVPLIALSGGFCAYLIIGITARSQEAYSQAADVALEVIGQMRTVHSFGGERKAFQTYLNALQSTKKLGIQAGLAKGLGVGSLYGVGFATFALLFLFSGKLIRNGITSGGEAFTTILNVISSSL